MKLDESKLRKTHGYLEGKSDAIDQISAQKAADYKQHFLKHFISINQRQIDSRLGGEKYFVTRKYDGEYAIIFYEKESAVIINRSGRVRKSLPCVDEAAAMIKKAGVREAVIPAELYIGDGRRKSRVNELVAALADEKKAKELKLAVFDIVELDGQKFKPKNYTETIARLNEVFSNGKLVHPVEMKLAKSAEEVKGVFQKWVEEEGSEGLVVRSEMPFVFKIKPRHSIDLAIVGFSEGTGVEMGRVRSLLTALMPSNGRYQVIGRVSSGLDEKLGVKLYKHLSKKVLPSEFIETDANSVAFQMVEPDTVVEVSVNDMLYEASEGPKENSVLEISKGGYRLHSLVRGMSFIAPVFVHIRDDKTVNPEDLRVSQTDGFFSPAGADETVIETEPVNLPQSTLMSREVYKKTIGDKLMVQKYLLWKTNKEMSGDYPAYVVHYTNFSTDRKDPLQREVVISDDETQIKAIFKEMIKVNIKQGWHRINGEKAKRKA